MNPDSTFMKIFFENCDGFSVSGSIEQWNDPEEIGGILTDEHVEPTTEVDLSNTKVAILKEMLELTIKNNLFVNEASQISNIFETRV